MDTKHSSDRLLFQYKIQIESLEREMVFRRDESVAQQDKIRNMKKEIEKRNAQIERLKAQLKGGQDEEEN